MSLFCCPLCAAPLTRGDHSYTCPGGHSFDLAARPGYVHLLPANRKHSQNPGDDKAMVAARSAFLDRGYYAPLRDALCGLALRSAGDRPAPALLDSGLRRGLLYLRPLSGSGPGGPRPLRGRGGHLQIRPAPGAARRLKEGEFAVASVYRLPLAPGSVDLLTNVFSPVPRGIRPGPPPRRALPLCGALSPPPVGDEAGAVRPPL